MNSTMVIRTLSASRCSVLFSGSFSLSCGTGKSSNERMVNTTRGIPKGTTPAGVLLELEHDSLTAQYCGTYNITFV